MGHRTSVTVRVACLSGWDCVFTVYNYLIPSLLELNTFWQSKYFFSSHSSPTFTCVIRIEGLIAGLRTEIQWYIYELNAFDFPKMFNFNSVGGVLVSKQSSISNKSTHQMFLFPCRLSCITICTVFYKHVAVLKNIGN